MRGSELNCTPGKGVGGGDEILPEFLSRALLSKRLELALSFLFIWIA